MKVVSRLHVTFNDNLIVVLVHTYTQIVAMPDLATLFIVLTYYKIGHGRIHHKTMFLHVEGHFWSSVYVYVVSIQYIHN